MSLAAIAAVLLSAVGHVYWNYQMKRSPAPAAFGWWLQVFGALITVPVWMTIARPFSLPLIGLGYLAGTGLLYAAYYSLIAVSYRHDDLSRAYPIVRGVAPMAAAILGILLLGEQPGAFGYVGIVAICAAVLLLALPAFKVAAPRGSPIGVFAAIGTGLCTAGYSLCDKQGVQHIHPSLYISLAFCIGAVGQWIVRRKCWNSFEVYDELRRARLPLLVSATVSAGSYLMVLYVLRSSPMSYVVPLRSVSVLLSVWVGSSYLGEDVGVIRYIAAALVVMGVAFIAMA